VHLFLWIAVAVSAPEAPTALHIGRITIEARAVFTSAEATGGFYRAVNMLHVQTPASLIRRFLLFHEGDAYDPAKLAETERNLRLFDFLTTASVTPTAPHDGVVDVVVVSQDAWTTDITGDFSNEGGTTAYTVDVTQKDLFGSGSALNLRLEQTVERNEKAIEFVTPAALGPYWNLEALYSRNSDGDEERLALERPLFSYATPWTASFLFDHLLRNERIFSEGRVAARFRQQHRELALSRSHVLHNDQRGSSRLVGGLDLLDDAFSPLPERASDLLPHARHFRFVDLGYEATGFQFVKLDYVDRDLLQQDFNLGRFTALHAAISPRSSADRDATWRFRAEEGAGFAFSARSFVLARLSAMTRAPRDRNTIISFDARAVTRFDTAFPQTFVAHARLDLGWQLDRDVQFLADGQNGLRAYPDFAFEGRRRVTLNAEHRIFLGREILQLFGPSIAVFADSGRAVDRSFGGMKSDAGIGLRIGIARYDAALIRIDYARAFNSSPLNRPGWVLSIATVQAF